MPGRDDFEFATRIKDDVPMIHESHRILPLVLRIRDQINEVFARYVGPIASELCLSEFDRWRAEEHVGPLGLHRYIERLGGYITEDRSRRAFTIEAIKCIQLLSGGKHS